jgi:hypothetical protein
VLLLGGGGETPAAGHRGRGSEGGEGAARGWEGQGFGGKEAEGQRGGGHGRGGERRMSGVTRGGRFWEEDEGGMILWIGGVADRSIRANGSDRSYIHSRKKT